MSLKNYCILVKAIPSQLSVHLENMLNVLLVVCVTGTVYAECGISVSSAI